MDTIARGKRSIAVDVKKVRAQRSRDAGSRASVLVQSVGQGVSWIWLSLVGGGERESHL